MCSSYTEIKILKMLNVLCKKGLVPTRAIVWIMILTACFVSYMLRVNMSINIIAMVEPSRANNEFKHEAECSIINANNSTNNISESISKLVSLPDYGSRYDWDSKTQGLILASYFWGYIITSIPGGFLAERFGPMKTIAISTLVSAALTLLTPLAASWNYAVVITLRFILGIMGGVVYPALHCLVSRWAPPVEKGKFTGALLGGTLGTVITWPMLGPIIETWGWKWAFFVPGGIALVWCFLWMLLIADLPENHPRISEEEKIYIVKSLGDNVGKVKAIPPYLKMFTSVPFWSLTALHFGNLWGLYLLLTSGPKFMSEVLGFNLGHSGVLAALPYLVRMLSGFFFGYIGDTIRKRSWLTVTMTRKSFIIASHFIPGLLLFALIGVGCNAILCVTLITLSLGMNGASTLTNLQNNQDLAPNFAGTIYGIINCIGGTTGFFTPMITGFITSENSGLHEWHIIFSIGASVYIASGIVFCVFGTGEQQFWNRVDIVPPPVILQEGVDNRGFESFPEVPTKSSNETAENTKM